MDYIKFTTEVKWWKFPNSNGLWCKNINTII